MLSFTITSRVESRRFINLHQIYLYIYIYGERGKRKKRKNKKRSERTPRMWLRAGRLHRQRWLILISRGASPSVTATNTKSKLVLAPATLLRADQIRRALADSHWWWWLNGPSVRPSVRVCTRTGVHNPVKRLPAQQPFPRHRSRIMAHYAA